jgi:LysR family glycine cleavage system transcriptional activator
MRKRNLPPLKALRAFEAAARLGSVTAAAREMAVTPSAISQQIRTLENWAGVQFIARGTTGFSLTDRGEHYLTRLMEVFDVLEEATDLALGRTGSTRLRVSVLPSFASRWLLPRLGRFADAHPSIEVEIDSSSLIADFNRDDVEIGIRYGLGQYPDAASELLLPDVVAPVCHPRLLTEAPGRPAITCPEDIARARLLHETGALYNSKLTWRDWFEAAGVDATEPMRGLVFSDTHLTIEAALAGEGVMLGRRVLVADLLADGRLVAPFEPWMRDHPAYHMVHSRLRTPRPAAIAFMRWLRQEAREMRAADRILAAQAPAVPPSPFPEPPAP